ncbi:MAG: hypothetical protein JSW38_06100 [Dehalococcoidia bacterium]|nr:MAG: hypothetical protein JSW38_06100 [Dehalococcoidia bacterium]
MAKKSKKTAARYSELSKAKKKKQQRGKTPNHIQTVSVTETSELTELETLERPVARQVTRPAPRAQTDGKRGMPSYQYVRADLKKIGILAGAMLVILIILSFVLG